MKAIRRLLIEEKPLQVLPSLAAKIGLNEALVLQQIYYWQNKSRYELDGKLWVYNTVKQWKENFPFWSEKTINRTLTSLRKQELVFTGNYNKRGFDRTLWYSVNIDHPALIADEESPFGQNDQIEKDTNDPFGQNDQMHLDKMTKCKGTDCPNPFGQNDQTNTRDYTETTQETTQRLRGEPGDSPCEGQEDPGEVNPSDEDGSSDGQGVQAALIDDSGLPPWLPAELWDDFKEHRKQLKAKMTEKAETMAITKLGKLRNEGSNPEDVIEQSIVNGWKGLFAVKKMGSNVTQISKKKKPSEMTETEYNQWLKEADYI